MKHDSWDPFFFSAFYFTILHANKNATVHFGNSWRAVSLQFLILFWNICVHFSWQSITFLFAVNCLNPTHQYVCYLCVISRWELSLQRIKEPRSSLTYQVSPACVQRRRMYRNLFIWWTIRDLKKKYKWKKNLAFFKNYEFQMENKNCLNLIFHYSCSFKNWESIYPLHGISDPKVIHLLLLSCTQ